MADLNYGPVDYTSRDYDSIKADLLAAVEERLPEWSGADDPNDYLRVILEAIAFVGALDAYYIDRVANEAFLATATQRQSLINIARTFGYSPAGPLPANLTLTLTNDGPDDVLVPTGSQFIGNYNRDGKAVTVTFETVEDVTVPANSTASVNSTEGASRYGSTLRQSNGDPVGVLLYRADGAAVSDGTPDQFFYIPEKPIVDSSVEIWVHPSTTDGTIADGVYFHSVENLIDANTDERAFTLLRNADDSAYIQFGDGANGFIPPTGHQVRAVYRIGGGSNGNVSPGTVTIVGTTANGSSLPTTLTVTHVTAGAGGVDSEPDEAIREKAYRTLRTNRRIVNLDDFIDVAVRSPGVARANVIGSAMSNVVVYIAPDVSQVDYQPGYVGEVGGVSNTSLTGGVATLNTAANHSLTVGADVTVSGCGFPFDGTWTITDVPNSTAFSFACPAAGTISSTAVSGKFTAVGAETDAFTSVRSYTQEVLDDAVPAGTGVTVVGPTYRDVTINATVQLAPNVRQSSARIAVTDAVLTTLSPMALDFGQTVYPSTVIAAIAGVSGVTSVQVTTFQGSRTFSAARAASGSGSYAVVQDSLVAAPHEIFRAIPQNVTITVVGGIIDAA